MTLSIIIVNYRSWDFLENCLNPLAADTSYEIIVVDNASDDQRLGGFQKRFPGVKFIESPFNGGFAFGCNLGASHATGELLLFLNPDVVTSPATIAELLEVRALHPEVVILTARQTDGRGRQQKAWDVFPSGPGWFKSYKSLARRLMPERYPNPYKERNDLVFCDWVSGSVVLIGRRHFDGLGGWSEDFWMYMEDCDLCFRAHEKGHQVACANQISMVHLHGGASRQNVDVAAVTKMETVISKHVYIGRHMPGLRGVTNHALVVTKTMLPLMLYSLLNLISFGSLTPLGVRWAMFKGLLGYYTTAPASRRWRSLRAPGVGQPESLR